MMKKNFHTLPFWLSIAAASLVLLPAPSARAQDKPVQPASGTGASAAPAENSAKPAPNPSTTDTAATPPDRASAYYHLALANIDQEEAVSEGRPELITRAIEEYKLALNADPGSPQLNDGLAELYFNTGRAHDAEVAARNLLKSSPNDVDAHKLLGRIYLRQLGEGQNSASSPSPTSNVLNLAIAEYEKIVALQPKSVEDRMVLGQLYTVKHDAKKAEEQFHIAQGIEPESEEVVLNLARLYAESGDIQHAAKVIQDVPEADRTPKMEFALGAAFDQLKQSKDAIAAYQRAADMDPGDAQTLDALARPCLPTISSMRH
jgi:tetratricopeptide (TPR) repeat protein